MTKAPIDFNQGDDLSDMLGQAPQPPRVLPQAEEYKRIRETVSQFEEVCPSCKGTGQFRTWSGRTLGQCFKCKGKGKRSFATSPEKRAQSRQAAATRKAADNSVKWDAFAGEQPEAAAWIVANAASFAFAASMREAVEKWGHLTAGQLAAVHKCIARNAERDAAKAAERTVQEARAVDLTATKIAEAFARARGEGLKRLTLRYDGIKIKQARGKADTLYVTDHRPYPDQTYYGKIVGERFMPSRDCPDAIAQRLLEIAQDPAAAAKVYGKKTGSCCCCGAELTDPVSIANGIGPICAGNYGF